MEVNLYFISILFIIFLIWYYYQKKFLHWADREIFSVKPTFPFGNLKNVRKTESIFIEVQNIYKHFYKRDVLCGMYLYATPVIVLMDLDIIKNVLITNFNSFHERGIYYNKNSDPLSAHLSSIEGIEWKLLRNKLNSVINTVNMQQMFEKINENTIFLKIICQKKSLTKDPINIKDISKRFIADIIGNCAFGTEFNAQTNANAEVIKISNQLFNTNWTRDLYIMFLNSFPMLSRNLGLRLFPTNISNYFLNVLHESLENRIINSSNRNDFFNILLNDMNSEEITNIIDKTRFNKVASEMFTFFFSGYETTSTLLSFALYELAENQDVQDKVRNEINTILDKYPNFWSYKAINEMEYLSQVVNETLRKYPPVSVLTRILENKYKVPGSVHVLEKGTKIFVPVYAIHHNPAIYPEPHIFNPERFSKDNINQRHPFAFLPFGEGPRNCIGMHLGKMQSIIGIAAIIRCFTLTVSTKTLRPFIFNTQSETLNVIGDIWLNFQALS